PARCPPAARSSRRRGKRGEPGLACSPSRCRHRRPPDTARRSLGCPSGLPKPAARFPRSPRKCRTPTSAPGGSPTGPCGLRRPPPSDGGKRRTLSRLRSTRFDVLPSVPIAQFQRADHPEEVPRVEDDPWLPEEGAEGDLRVDRPPVEAVQFLGHRVDE